MQKTGRIHTESFGFGNEICPFFSGNYKIKSQLATLFLRKE